MDYANYRERIFPIDRGDGSVDDYHYNRGGRGRNEPGALLNIINAARFEQFVNERILELRIVCVAKKNSFTNDLVVLSFYVLPV